MNKIFLRSATFMISLAVLLLGAAGPARAQRCTPEQQVLAQAIQAEVDQLCPCDNVWKNHGRYVSCVARNTNRLFKQQGIARSCKRVIRRCAARSTCGKDGAVRCCLARTSSCENDPTPGDSIAEGTCARTGAACDTDADCVTLRCKISRRPERCTSKGGVISGTGSCCGACVR